MVCGVTVMHPKPVMTAKDVLMGYSAQASGLNAVDSQMLVMTQENVAE